MATAGGMDLRRDGGYWIKYPDAVRPSADQMDRVGDTLTAAFTRTNTDLRALGETMKYAGPVAGKLGISLEQAAAMAGVLANMGIRGSDAGRQCASLGSSGITAKGSSRGAERAWCGSL